MKRPSSNGLLEALQQNQETMEVMQRDRVELLLEHEDDDEKLVDQFQVEMQEELENLERAMTLEKEALEQQMTQHLEECHRKLAEAQKQLDERQNELSKMAWEKEELARLIAEFKKESENLACKQKLEKVRLKEETAKMELEMVTLREEANKKIYEEKKAHSQKLFQARSNHKMQLEKEKAQMAAELEAARIQTEKQIQLEKKVTEEVKKAIRELPPLQAAMELGDIRILEDEVQKWSTHSSDGFGECKGVVDAVLSLARERLVSWRGVEHGLKDILRQVESLERIRNAATLGEHCQRLFRALKEAQLTKMNLHRSDPEAIERIKEVLTKWQEKSMVHSNMVQQAILRKVLACPQLGPFDFADLDICLRLVDRDEVGTEVFLSRALAVVEDESVAPKDLRNALSHIETMLFFLKYSSSEDLQLAHEEFTKQNSHNPTIMQYLTWAKKSYPPGSELVRLSRNQKLMDSAELDAVLEQLQRPAKTEDGLGLFRDIFYQWAQVMRNKFDLLVLPHHTQVICLLAFKYFLEAPKDAKTPRALVAQVGTGEGKSMIVAALALYVAVALKKQVHVVVDDETLLERDFWTFKALFDGVGLSAVLCVSEERLSQTREPCLSARVDPHADICYCEAKHVQSFYASIARSGNPDFSSYDNCVLILDEVDALIIDEEPNEAFVYPNSELSDLATKAAEALSKGVPKEHLMETIFGSACHPAAARVAREVSSEWMRGKEMIPGEDFVYSKEAGRYCALHAGRANSNAWSLALECRNYQDELSKGIFFQERLFVMSRPRVFRKYQSILGLSGSIGSKAERSFLQDTYGAAFFEVPPFLKTCQGSPFHDPVPAKLGQARKAVHVESTLDQQLQRVVEVALEARENVPVLVIAKDRGQVDSMLKKFQDGARSRGLGGVSDDMIRSLSRKLWESDPEQWKENLSRATMPLGDSNQAKGKSWRVTITDPRGGRGTDYRVDHPEVNEHGGLLLITTHVPTSQRAWTQFLGRTARQDRKGQFCVVLCSEDYKEYTEKYGRLPDKGGLETINAILTWGDLEFAERVRKAAALYNCGVRVNELCEDIFARKKNVLEDSNAREKLVDVCQRFRWLSVKEIDMGFSKIPLFDPAFVATEAKDLGPAEILTTSVSPPFDRTGGNGQNLGRQSATPLTGGYPQPKFTSLGTRAANPSVPPRNQNEPKIVIFCLDWSFSMTSRDTGKGGLTRLQMCIQSVLQILEGQVRPKDLVGIVGFGPKVQTVLHPIQKGETGAVTSAIRNIVPASKGGTAFFDAVAHCLQTLNDPVHWIKTGQSNVKDAGRWLVCLTDGDDIGSQQRNANGEMVTSMLQSGSNTNLNIMMITVGALKEKNIRVIDHWMARVNESGGMGRHISQQDAAAIGQAFETVADCIAGYDVGGAVEC